MKFSINKKYDRKTRRGLNNQQLKFLTQVENRESLKLVFLFFFFPFNSVKTDIPCFFFCLGGSNVHVYNIRE